MAATWKNETVGTNFGLLMDWGLTRNLVALTSQAERTEGWNEGLQFKAEVPPVQIGRSRM